MRISFAIETVRNLLAYRRQVIIDADGADDRIYPSDTDWDAIEELLLFVEGS